VSNIGSAATDGTAVNLVDTLPAGLVATGMSGSGWTVNLTTLTATRKDVLGSNASYPALTITVDVSHDALPSVTNVATVSGGGEFIRTNDTASDATTITPGAAAVVWLGGHGNDWSTGANWSTGNAPTAGARLFFQGTYTTSVDDLTAPPVFDSITFENGDFSISGSAGNAIALHPQGGIAIDSAGGENSISLPVTLNEAATFLIESNGGLSFGASATIQNGGYLLTAASGNQDAAQSVWLGPVVGAGGLTKVGGGGLTLEGTSSYGDGTKITGGTLVLAGNDCLPIGTTVTLGDTGGDSGILELGDGTTQTIGGLASAENASTDNGANNRVIGGGANVATLTLNVTDSPDFKGVVGGPGQYDNNLALVIDGTGTEALDSSSTYTGGTTI
jgi:hypothetical protein